jgi:hypothetical protein
MPQRETGLSLKRRPNPLLAGAPGLTTSAIAASGSIFWFGSSARLA